jgi:hypothetical protein
MVEERKRDRSGEPFQDAFTENRGVHRDLIEKAQHDLNMEGENVTNDEQRKENDGTEKEQHPQGFDQPQKVDQP